MSKITQIRMDTNYIVGQIAEKYKFTDETCQGCNGGGLAPAIMGLQDACVICMGTGKKINMKATFKKGN